AAREGSLEEVTAFARLYAELAAVAGVAVVALGIGATVAVERAAVAGAGRRAAFVHRAGIPVVGTDDGLVHAAGRRVAAVDCAGAAVGAEGIVRRAQALPPWTGAGVSLRARDPVVAPVTRGTTAVAEHHGALHSGSLRHCARRSERAGPPAVRRLAGAAGRAPVSGLEVPVVTLLPCPLAVAACGEHDHHAVAQLVGAGRSSADVPRRPDRGNRGAEQGRSHGYG